MQGDAVMEHFPFLYSSLQLDSFLLRKMYIPCLRICSLKLKKREYISEKEEDTVIMGVTTFFAYSLWEMSIKQQKPRKVCAALCYCVCKTLFSLFSLPRMLNRSPSLGIDSSIRLYGRFLDDC